MSERLSSGELPGVPGGLTAFGALTEVACLSPPNHVKKYLPKLVNLVDGVVVDERRAVDAGVEAGAEAFHQSRSVHVAVSNANAPVRHGLGDECRRDAGKAETKCGNAFGQLRDVVYAVNDGAGGMQNFEHLERKSGFVLAD